ncbi:MAG TPA: hypothetical protein PKA90_15160 [Ignavibacteria bacterium]|nr:hypothetical protein [Ignavibacteria bacterium]HMR41757.1 hypothetical protein [Ignavibacteria bacterium]
MKTTLTPSGKILILVTVFFMSAILISENSHPFIGCKKEEVAVKQDSIVPWKFPEASSIPDNEEGKIIKLGRDIFLETFKYIGPDVKDSSKRFTGNNMDCQNCHFSAGTSKTVFGLVGVYSKYPALDDRLNKVVSLQDRINSCLMRSMNGKAMPVDNPEMKALTAYLKWLGTYVPKGKRTDGGGLPKIELINRAADPSKGKLIFLDKCMTCHADNGSGIFDKPDMVDVAADSVYGYKFPPVMGVTSYNNGAGMYRLIVAAAFIYNKMPFNDAVLSVEESFDVAAYINTEPRPVFANSGSDYPDLKLKPVDSPFPPYDDTYSELQHKYGPFQPMVKLGEGSSMIEPDNPAKK